MSYKRSRPQLAEVVEESAFSLGRRECVLNGGHRVFSENSSEGNLADRCRKGFSHDFIYEGITPILRVFGRLFATHISGMANKPLGNKRVFGEQGPKKAPPNKRFKPVHNKPPPPTTKVSLVILQYKTYLDNCEKQLNLFVDKHWSDQDHEAFQPQSNPEGSERRKKKAKVGSDGGPRLPLYKGSLSSVVF